MQPAASAGLLGSASLLTATYGEICVELKFAATSGARDSRPVGKAMTAVQGS